MDERAMPAPTERTCKRWSGMTSDASPGRSVRRGLLAWRVPACWLLAALALSACALPEPPPPKPHAPPRVVLRTVRLPPRPVRKPTPPAAPAVDPEHVIGLGEVDAAEWLGEPGGRTEAPPATIWHYASLGCEVDVYFYLDLESKTMRALHYEVRGDGTGEQRPQRCFEQLVDEQRQRGHNAAATGAR